MAAAEREKLVQLRVLNAFLAKLTALDDETKRFDSYVRVYYKLHQQQRAEQKNGRPWNANAGTWVSSCRKSRVCASAIPHSRSWRRAGR
jgi:hypothetical protein